MSRSRHHHVFILIDIIKMGRLLSQKKKETRYKNISNSFSVFFILLWKYIQNEGPIH